MLKIAFSMLGWEEIRYSFYRFNLSLHNHISIDFCRVYTGMSAQLANRVKVASGSQWERSHRMPCRVETMSGLHEVGIKIGFTSGYTRQMMDVVIPAAARKGYVVDNCVTSDNLPSGRPFPYAESWCALCYWFYHRVAWYYWNYQPAVKIEKARN